MKYRVEVGPFAFGQSFVLRLTDEQAAARMHLLQKDGADFTVVDKPVEFKTGEIVEVIAGDIGRAGQDRLVALDLPEVAAKTTKTAEPAAAHEVKTPAPATTRSPDRDFDDKASRGGARR